MPIPDFVQDLRAKVGHDPLWLTGVTAIVLADLDDREHVLLGRRSDNGEWNGVYGILEPGEEPAVAAAREVLEETGVHAEPVALAAVTAGQEVVRYPNGDTAQYLDLTFEFRPVDGAHADLRAAALVGDDESTAVGWFPVDELPAPTGRSLVERLGHVLRHRTHPSAGPYFVRP